MSEIEEVRLKIKNLEETWIGYLESYNNELIPICQTIIEDMRGRLGQFGHEKGEPDLGRRTRVYCSWQEYEKYKILAHATSNDDYEYRFFVEMCTSGTYGNRAMVEWFEDMAEFKEWLNDPQSVAKLEQICKKLYCNHFINTLGLVYVREIEEPKWYDLWKRKVERFVSKVSKRFHKKSSDDMMEDFDLDMFFSREDGL